MAVVSIDFKPPQKTLRQFGFISLVAFVLLGLLVLWKEGLFGFDFGDGTRTTAWVLFALGVTSAVLSLVAPGANRPLYLALTVITYPIGFVLSYVIMAVIFYGLITPVALVFRLIGRDHLALRFDRAADSYWVERKRPVGIARYFRQY